MDVYAGKYRIYGVLDVLFVWYVLACYFVFVLSASTQVDHEYYRGLSSKSHYEIIRADVAIYESTAMKHLYSIKYLQ